MFSLRRWINQWRRPVVIAFDDLDTQALADRVHSRMLDVGDTEDPVQAMLRITAEEAQEQRMMQQIRGAAKMRDLMEQLPLRQRSVLLDHIERGLNYKQIARERGLTDRIVLRDLMRAYSFFRLNMRSDDERSSDDNGDHGTPAVAPGLSGVWPTPAHVGVFDGVCDGGPAFGRVPGSRDDKRPDAGGKESG